VGREEEGRWGAGKEIKRRGERKCKKAKVK